MRSRCHQTGQIRGAEPALQGPVEGLAVDQVDGAGTLPGRQHVAGVHVTVHQAEADGVPCATLHHARVVREDVVQDLAPAGRQRIAQNVEERLEALADVREVALQLGCSSDPGPDPGQPLPRPVARVEPGQRVRDAPA
jgi:hypothetical protein